MKHIVRVTMLICLSMMITTTIFAGNGKVKMKTDPPPDDGGQMTLLGGSGDNYQYLSYSDSDIVYTGDGGINFKATTDASQFVDEIYARANLKYWTGSTWSTVAIVHETLYNDISVEASGSLTVQKGYYYKVDGYHKVTHNGVTETDTSESSVVAAD